MCVNDNKDYTGYLKLFFDEDFNDRDEFVEYPNPNATITDITIDTFNDEIAGLLKRLGVKDNLIYSFRYIYTFDDNTYNFLRITGNRIIVGEGLYDPTLVVDLQIPDDFVPSRSNRYPMDDAVFKINEELYLFYPRVIIKKLPGAWQYTSKTFTGIANSIEDAVYKAHETRLKMIIDMWTKRDWRAYHVSKYNELGIGLVCHIFEDGTGDAFTYKHSGHIFIYRGYRIKITDNKTFMISSDPDTDFEYILSVPTLKDALDEIDEIIIEGD